MGAAGVLGCPQPIAIVASQAHLGMHASSHKSRCSWQGPQRLVDRDQVWSTRIRSRRGGAGKREHIEAMERGRRPRRVDTELACTEAKPPRLVEPGADRLGRTTQVEGEPRA